MSALTCIACLRACDAAAADAYQPLQHFDDLCICRQCLDEARTGRARLAGRQSQRPEPAGD